MKLFHATHKEQAIKILLSGFTLPDRPGELGKGIYTVSDTWAGVSHLEPFLELFGWKCILELDVDIKPEEIIMVEYGDFDNFPYRPTQPASRLEDWSEVVIYDLSRIRSVRKLSKAEWKLVRLSKPPIPPPSILKRNSLKGDW